ncbi:MAG: cytochrome ubiquinol oxidase subunit I [Ignavibacteria bacterium]|jgi:cytochrome d ubiquinol oxidase subunit I|nr:cytochrome ubiquinol oxidase subunit I [Ignavibacteria bacterium]
MDVELLSRIQFALTVGFHFLYPPMSIGLGLILVVFEGMYVKTKSKKFEQLTRFWLKLFAITFGVGVATGVVMEFEFGTNWAGYSRYVGDVFGSPLAAEAVFAFFLESTFLAILLFGWNKVSTKTHFVSTILVAFGAHLSALWILIANSWMQTPTGFHIVGSGSTARAEIIDFWAMVFNPSTIERYTHTVVAAWLTGAALVISVSAYFLLKKKYEEHSLASLKIGVAILVVASVLQLVTGHSNAVMVTDNQPTKLAAFEGHYKTGPADMYLIGWVDVDNEKVYGIKLPGMLSFLARFDCTAPLKGLEEFSPEDRPNIQVVFQSYHIMVALGILFLAVSALSLFLWWKKKLPNYKLYLWGMSILFIFPHIANQFGWIAAEVGRQPWIVYNILRTKDALSASVSAGEVLFSIILFTLIYIFTLLIFIYTFIRTMKKGMDIPELPINKVEVI